MIKPSPVAELEGCQWSETNNANSSSPAMAHVNVVKPQSLRAGERPKLDSDDLLP